MKIENIDVQNSGGQPFQITRFPQGQKIMKVVRLPMDGKNQSKQVIVIPDQNNKVLQGVNFQPLKPIQPIKTMFTNGQPDDLQDFLRDAIIRPITNIIPQVRLMRSKISRRKLQLNACVPAGQN